MPDIRADFSERVCVETHRAPWLASPANGVERRMLDRIGDEQARATSIVRYAPGSVFPSHEHGLGEEFLVLEGVFEDEHGRYPAGTYVRNPPGSAHAPRAPNGCTIFVKLRQFRAADHRHCVIDTSLAAWSAGPVPGVERLRLHDDGHESVALLRWREDAGLPEAEYPGGMECLVLDGHFADAEGSYTTGTWLRLPPGSGQRARGAGGCRLWIKTGHLAAQA
ncbi:MAG: cupin domain-containing protein [Rhodocyclaceae bacterium]|nr:cupin domain-containing protein [Rhodocyclaceae bacterium]